ncbi:plasmid replication initiator RepA [Escherichia coli]|uniref:plasmid replication initiator RepA n=1 Tax=Escherichia coli TaxID=562 RepID=UPI003D15AC35
MHMSLHPFYVQKRTYAGRNMLSVRKNNALLDAIWPVLVSFSDAGTHTVGMSVSRLAREISPKDSKGKVIPELEVTVSRLSRLLANRYVLVCWVFQRKPCGTVKPASVLPRLRLDNTGRLADAGRRHGKTSRTAAETTAVKVKSASQLIREGVLP